MARACDHCSGCAREPEDNRDRTARAQRTHDGDFLSAWTSEILQSSEPEDRMKRMVWAWAEQLPNMAVGHSCLHQWFVFLKKFYAVLGMEPGAFTLSYISSPFFLFLILRQGLDRLLSCPGSAQTRDLPASASHSAGISDRMCGRLGLCPTAERCLHSI